MSLSFTQIMIIVAVVVVLVALVRLTQPRLTLHEQYLLKVVQLKSPQMDNIRLFMWVKMVIHPTHDKADLEYQKRYLDDVEHYKQLCEQFHFYGANALYPLLGYDAINWNIDPKLENPLLTRLAANQVCRRYPHTAEVIEDLLIKSPDSVSFDFISHKSTDFPGLEIIQQRYKTNLLNILTLIVTTSRNDWWPGTSPDIHEWAEFTLKKFEKTDL